MRYTITSQQLSYFQKEGNIELEGIYTQEECENLKELLQETFVKRMPKSAKDHLLAGHDLQRENPGIYRALHTTRLGQVGSQLFNKKKLLIAFTQYDPVYEKVVETKELGSYTEVCGCMILSPENTTFYKADFPIDFTSLATPSFLVVFATDKARFHPKESDANRNYPKKLGYSAGDRVTSDTHPLISK